MDAVGKDGVITVEESKTAETKIELVEGMQFDRGYISPYFVTDRETHGSLARRPLPPALGEEDQQHPGAPAAAGEGRQGGRPLAIIAEDVEGEALATLVVNRLRGTLNVSR